MNTTLKISIIATAICSLAIGLSLASTETHTPIDFGNVVVSTRATSSEALQQRQIQTIHKIQPAPIAPAAVEQPTAASSVAASTASISIEGSIFDVPIRGGEKVFEVMNALKAGGKIDFTSREYLGMGEMILSINGKSSNGDMTWIFYVNGKQSNVGVSSVRVSPGDVIEWKYEETY